MKIKQMVLAAAFTSAFVVAGLYIPAPAFAHEFATQEEVAALKARADVLEGHLNTLVNTDSDLFELFDELMARVDLLEGRISGQSTAIDDIYAILDRMSKAMEGADETSGPAVRE